MLQTLKSKGNTQAWISNWVKVNALYFTFWVHDRKKNWIVVQNTLMKNSIDVCTFLDIVIFGKGASWNGILIWKLLMFKGFVFINYYFFLAIWSHNEYFYSQHTISMLNLSSLWVGAFTVGVPQQEPWHPFVLSWVLK
jgi:hypothetical protein